MNSLEAIQERLQRAVAAASPEPTRFTFYSARDFEDFPPVTWRVSDVLPTAGLACIFGPPASGKSFLLLDLVAAVATGSDWFGHKTLPCRIVCIFLEGRPGVRQRVRGWETHNGREFPTNVSFVLDDFALTAEKDVADMEAAIAARGGADMVLIDTLNRAAPNADENSSRDMGIILAAAGKLQRVTEGLVILVHHTGKDASRGMRGHSSLHAGTDAAIEVARDDEARTWKLLKAKDGQDGQVFGFHLPIVEFSDSADNVVTSCVVAPIAVTGADGEEVKQPKGTNQKIVYSELVALLGAAPDQANGGAPPGVPCIELDDAISRIKDKLPVDPKRRGERVRAAITQLVANGLIDCSDGWLWRA